MGRSVDGEALSCSPRRMLKKREKKTKRKEREVGKTTVCTSLPLLDHYLDPPTARQLLELIEW
jgi:hypothetical protein